METKTVSIKGMHCKSCEILIEDELKEIKQIKKIDISHRTGIATIHYEGKSLDENDIARAVEKAGYSLGSNEKLPLFSHKTADYLEISAAAVILILLYFILQEMGLFNVGLFGHTNFKSLPVVFLVGLTAGVSTCMALVGGLVLGVASRFAQQNEHATAREKFIPHLFFNLGRIMSFFILGGIIGAIGSVFQLSPVGSGILMGMVGISMTILGLQLIGLFPRLSTVSFSLPKGISRALGISNQEDRAYSHISTIGLGALTFFIPCGFTQAIQLFAMTTGSFFAGALTLSVFALGTAPGLLSLGGATSFIRGKSSGFLFKFVGLIVIAAAVFNMQNGLALVGFTKQVSRPVEQQDPNVKIENGVQIIRMEQNDKGYSPNSFTIKKNMPVKWVIKSTYPYSCASSLVVQKLNIRTLLTDKEQTFTFTPKETGDISFSCTMGMYSGVITVEN